MDRVTRYNNADQIGQTCLKKCPTFVSVGVLGNFRVIFGPCQTVFRHFVMILHFWAVQRYARYKLSGPKSRDWWEKNLEGLKSCVWLPKFCRTHYYVKLGDGPNTVSGSTASNTELSEFFCLHRVPVRELSEFLSAYYLCELTEFSLPQNSVRLSEFSSPKQFSRNSIPPFILGETFPRNLPADPPAEFWGGGGARTCFLRTGIFSSPLSGCIRVNGAND